MNGDPQKKNEEMTITRQLLVINNRTMDNYLKFKMFCLCFTHFRSESGSFTILMHILAKDCDMAMVPIAHPIQPHPAAHLPHGMSIDQGMGQAFSGHHPISIPAWKSAEGARQLISMVKEQTPESWEIELLQVWLCVYIYMLCTYIYI